jgi:hypothetical protein
LAGVTVAIAHNVEASSRLSAVAATRPVATGRFERTIAIWDQHVTASGDIPELNVTLLVCDLVVG